MSGVDAIPSAITLLNQGEYQNALSLLSVVSSSSPEWQTHKQEIKNILISRYHKQQIGDDALYRYIKLFNEKGDKTEAEEVSRLIPNHPEVKKANEKHPILRLWKFIRQWLSKIFDMVLGFVVGKLLEVFSTSTAASSATTGTTLGTGAATSTISVSKIAIVGAIVVATTATVAVIISPIPRIVYTSNEDGDFEIYAMNTDGTNIEQITRNGAKDNQPNWVLGGSKIVFTSNRDGNSEIYIMDADGGGQRNLTHNPYEDTFPQISPDGEEIIFNSTRYGDNEIFIMNVDGSNLRQLTNNNVDDYWATWIPISQKILFASGESYKHDIFVMDVDGSNPQQLTNDPSDDIDPIVSPNGDKIVFISARTGTYQLYQMNIDGKNEAPIVTIPSSVVLHGDWSPDGNQVIVMVSPSSCSVDFSILASWGNCHDLYVVNMADSSWKKLTTNGFDEGEPDWSP